MRVEFCCVDLRTMFEDFPDVMTIDYGRGTVSDRKGTLNGPLNHCPFCGSPIEISLKGARL